MRRLVRRSAVAACVAIVTTLVVAVHTVTGYAMSRTGDPLDQPVPKDGVWSVPAGFPKDLPPPNWRGEPDWFKGSFEVLTAQKLRPACSSTTPLTVPIADPDDIESITPQGFMQPGAHAMPVPHMYYNTGPGVAPLRSARVQVVAPARMTLRGASKWVVQTGSSAYTEWILGFHLCGKLWMFTAHLDDLNPIIAAAIRKAPKVEEQRNQQGQVAGAIYSYMSLSIAAGTRIGTSSGRAHGFDFGLTDTSKPVAGRLDPSAYPVRWVAGVCHLKYYTPAVRARLWPKLQGYGTDTFNGCGQLSSDVAGTASGQWLASGQRANASSEDLHIALARHWSDRTQQVFSIGARSGVTGVEPATYSFTPQASGDNRDFSKVRPQQTVCYDQLTRINSVGPTATILIRVAPAANGVERITIWGASGGCTDVSRTAPQSAKVFERRTTLR